jgi:cytochrome c
MKETDPEIHSEGACREAAQCVGNYRGALRGAAASASGCGLNAVGSGRRTEPSMIPTSHQKQSAVRSSVRLPSAFAVSLGAGIVILAGLITFPRISGADTGADRGKELFEKRCTGCHSLDQDKEGPRLRSVFGRQAGKIPTFKYSTALQSSHFIWDDASLDKWLTDPDSLIADNDMAFRVVKPDERADIIRFLKAVSLK